MQFANMWQIKRWCVNTIIHYLAPECCLLLRAVGTSVHDSGLSVWQTHVDLWDVTMRSRWSSRTNDSNDDYKKERWAAKQSTVCQDLSHCKRQEWYKSFHQKYFSFTKPCWLAIKSLTDALKWAFSQRAGNSLYADCGLLSLSFFFFSFFHSSAI